MVVTRRQSLASGRAGSVTQQDVSEGSKTASLKTGRIVQTGRAVKTGVGVKEGVESGSTSANTSAAPSPARVKSPDFSHATEADTERVEKEQEFTRLLSVWCDGSICDGVDACIRYSSMCVDSRSFCDERMTDAMTRFVATATLSSFQLAKILTSLKEHWERQIFSDLSVSRLIGVCLLNGSLTEAQCLLCDMASVKPDLVLEQLVSRFAETPSRIKLILGVVTRLGVREGARFVSSLHSACSSGDSFVGFVRDVGKSLPSAVAVFLVQVIAYHAVKNQQINVISVLLEVLPSLPSSGLAATVLPRPLFPVPSNESVDPTTVETCSDCIHLHKDAEKYNLQVFGFSELEKIRLFRCACCRRLFSRDCDTCSGCPVVVNADLTCWGCGYRLIASSVSPAGNVVTSTDGALVGKYLILASFQTDPAMQLFVRDFLFPDLPGASAAVENGGSVPTLSPAFVQELQLKLGLSQKINAIAHTLIKALMAVAPPSAASLKALSGCIARWPALHDAAEQYALSLIRSVDASRWINHVVPLVAALPPRADSTLEIIAVMQSSRLQVSVKKLILKHLIGKQLHNVDLVDSFIQYLFVDELVDGEGLVDVFVEILNLFWRTLLVAEFSDHFTHIAGQFELSLLYRDRFANAVNPDLISKLLHSQPSDAAMGVVAYLCAHIRGGEEVGAALFRIAEGGNVFALSSVITASTSTPQRMHALVYSKLIPLLVGGNSATVRAAAHLIAKIDEIFIKSFSQKDSVVTQLIERFAADLDSVRNCWAIASFLEVSGDASWVSSTVTQLLETQKFDQPSTLPLLGFMATNKSVREDVIVRSQFLGPIEAAFGDPAMQTKVLDVLINVLQSATEHGGHSRPEGGVNVGSNRPDGGVSCRSLSRFFHRISQDLLFDSRPVIVAKALRVIQLMDKLGIVNRHTLPPILFARYVLSVPSETDEPDDGIDVNLYSWTLFKSVFDARFKHSLLPTVMCEVKRRLGSNGVAGSVNRLCEFLFSSNPTEFTKKEDSRHALGILWNELTRQSSDDHNMLTFLVVAIVCGVSSFPEEKGAIVEKANQQHALSEKFVYAFLAAELAGGGVKTASRGEMIISVLERYRNGTISSPAIANVEPEPKAPTTRKRRRSSLDRKRPATKKARRKTIAQLAEGSSDDEYTDGATSGDEEDNF